MGFFRTFTSFWGAASAVSAAFPLLNKLFAVLPMIHNQEELQTALSSVFSVYALALGYTSRGLYPKRTILASMLYVNSSLICLMVYLYCIGVKGPYDPMKVVFMMTSYILFAFCITAAFSMLAVHEFMGTTIQSTSTMEETQ